MNMMAFIHREKGNLPFAMELHLQVLEIARANNLGEQAGLAMVRLGNIYRDLKDYSSALNYQRQGLATFENIHNARGIVIAKLLIGQTLQEENQLDSALYYEEQVKSDSSQFPDITTSMLNILGRIQVKKNNYQLALTYYRQCVDVSLQINDLRTILQVYSNISQLYIKLKQADSSIYYANKALVSAEQVSNKLGVLSAATTLSEIYEPIDVKKAFEYQKRAVAVKDSLYSNEKLQALQTMTFNEQERQRNFEIEKKVYQSKIRQYVMLGALAIFIIIAIILYRNDRQKHKVNSVLKKTVANLRSTQTQLIQSEKMASLGELTAGIAHEIQNPLNFVNNFSEVSKELLDEMKVELDSGNTADAKEIANDVIQNLEKINHHGKRAGDIVKGMLQHSRSSSGVKELTNINKLADEYLRLVYHGLRAKDKDFNATLKTDFDESLSAGEAGIGKINIIPQDIGRVLLNLYNNAFYAVQEKQKEVFQTEVTPFEKVSPLYEPVVSVSTKKVDNSILISVKDNGNGIPKNIIDKIFQPFFTTKPTGQGTGLGLSLSYDIAKAHGGELKVETKEGEGTSFIIQLPSSV